jgi:hypothetical protein
VASAVLVAWVAWVAQAELAVLALAVLAALAALVSAVLVALAVASIPADLKLAMPGTATGQLDALEAITGKRSNHPAES